VKSVGIRIAREFLDAYYPSKRSLFFCATVTLCLLAGPIVIDLSTQSVQSKCGCAQAGASHSLGTDVIATVHAGLGAIIFPIVVFVAGFASGTTPVAGVPRSEVLLKVSYLFPLSFFAITSTGVFLVPGLYLSLIWTEIILILGSVFAVYQIIALSLNELRLLESGVNLLRDVVRRDIQSAFRVRIDNNRLLARISRDDSRIEYRLWAED
jgi:hypothetical protein